MKTISTLLLFSMILYCRTAKHMTIYDQVDYNVLNEISRGKEGKLIMRNGQRIVGHDIVIGSDSTSCIENPKPYEYGVPATRPAKRTLATLEIEKVVFKNLGQGAKGGFVYVFLTAANLGTGLSISLHSEGPIRADEGSSFIPAALTLIAAGGLMGGLFGIPIGLAAGGKDEYIFTDLPADSISTKSERKR